ncbi:MAG: trigger factor [Coriobacteriales bacterium]|jgi:trigger factor|nr:trigger factor [Coriobacteriales bacterium]
MFAGWLAHRFRRAIVAPRQARVCQYFREESWTALDTTSKRLEDNKVELTVTIPADEVTKSVTAAYKQASKARIPGFRPGKAPRHVLDKNFGGKEYFLAQATEEILKTFYPLAIDEQNLIALDQPDFSQTDLVADGEPYVFTFSFAVSPEFELTSYDAVQIELPSEEASPAEIDSQIESLLEYYVTYEEVGDRAAKKGDEVTLDMEVTAAGELVEAVSGDDRPYVVGSDTMPESFDKNIKGLKTGDEKEFDFSFADDAPDEPPLHVKVKLKGIRLKKLPELTDAWVKETIEFEGVDELKKRIADSIKAQKQGELPPLKESLCSVELVKRLEGEPSEQIVKQTEQGIYRDFFDQLQRQSLTFDAYLQANGIKPDQFRDDVHNQAVSSAKASLALDALARHLHLTVTEEEILEEFNRSGAPNPDELYAQWKTLGRISEIREGLLRVKAAKHLNETAEVFEPGKKPAEKKAKAKKSAAKADKPAPVDADAQPASATADEKPAKKPRAKKTDRSDDE